MSDIENVIESVESDVSQEECGISRGAFIGYMLLINIVLAIPIKIASGLMEDESYWLAIFLYGVYIFITTKVVGKRCSDIGVKEGAGALVTVKNWYLWHFWMFIGLGFVFSLSTFWWLVVLPIFTFIVFMNLYLIFTPSEEDRVIKQEQKRYKKIKDDLLEEKRKLIEEKEIKQLKAEIEYLKKNQD